MCELFTEIITIIMNHLKKYKFCFHRQEHVLPLDFTPVLPPLKNCSTTHSYPLENRELHQEAIAASALNRLLTAPTDSHLPVIFISFRKQECKESALYFCHVFSLSFLCSLMVLRFTSRNRAFLT